MEKKIQNIACLSITVVFLSQTGLIFSMNEETAAKSLQEQCKQDPLLPTVLIHGLGSTGAAMKNMEEFIHDISPSTIVRCPDLPDRAFGNIQKQADHLAFELSKEPDLEQGFNMIGQSMGGIVARVVIEQGTVPRVYTYCSIGTPQQGISGLPGEWDDDLDEFFDAGCNCRPCDSFEKKLSRLAYTDEMQRQLSVANIWHDPTKERKYQKYTFLAELNNEIGHPRAELYRENIMRLAQLISLHGRDDAIIEPGISSLWGYQDKPNRRKEAMVNQVYTSNIYKNLGISQLDAQGAFHIAVVDGDHLNIIQNQKLFLEHIAPYLTHESAKKDAMDR